MVDDQRDAGISVRLLYVNQRPAVYAARENYICVQCVDVCVEICADSRSAP